MIARWSVFWCTATIISWCGPSPDRQVAIASDRATPVDERHIDLKEVHQFGLRLSLKIGQR